jgi:hypothetical protein
MYINLDEGKIWAANFELNAWNNTNSGLYLNSNPISDTDYYFKVGKTNSDLISLSKSGNLTLKCNNNFTLSTSSIYFSDTAK